MSKFLVGGRGFPHLPSREKPDCCYLIFTEINFGKFLNIAKKIKCLKWQENIVSVTLVQNKPKLTTYFFVTFCYFDETQL